MFGSTMFNFVFGGSLCSNIFTVLLKLVMMPIMDLLARGAVPRGVDRGFTNCSGAVAIPTGRSLNSGWLLGGWFFVSFGVLLLCGR